MRKLTSLLEFGLQLFPAGHLSNVKDRDTAAYSYMERNFTGDNSLQCFVLNLKQYIKRPYLLFLSSKIFRHCFTTRILTFTAHQQKKLKSAAIRVAYDRQKKIRSMRLVEANIFNRCCIDDKAN